MVPQLREVHVIRDSWTKLNVAPAKILHVCNCIVSYYQEYIILESVELPYSPSDITA